MDLPRTDLDTPFNITRTSHVVLTVKDLEASRLFYTEVVGLIVTERIAPFLHYPITTIRQTDEGTVMLGDSQEEAGFDPTVGTGVTSVLADRAIRMFPRLGALNVVRTWAALRVMTKDGFPIYEQSETCPGAFVATCHSGVTLCAAHAFQVALSLSCATGYSMPFCFNDRSTLDALRSKVNSGVWTPTIVSPSSRYALSQATRYGSVRMQLMQV